MNTDQLDDVVAWFRAYTGSYVYGSERMHPMLSQKVDHSFRVAEECRTLARYMYWSRSATATAEALGLLHDVGRFPQFQKHGTFSDSLSVDHGRYGRLVLEESMVLSLLCLSERVIILDAVGCHNARNIPDDFNPESLPFLMLLRDADKLDILEFVLGCVERDGFKDLPNMLPGVALHGQPSPRIMDDLLNRRCSSLRDVRTLADFLLMQLSWVYDFNFVITVQHFRERGLLLRLHQQLGDSPDLCAIIEIARSYIAWRVSNQKPKDEVAKRETSKAHRCE